MAAIEYRGLNAVTNFDLSRYIKWLKPDQTDSNNSNNIQTNSNHPNISQDSGLTLVYDNQNHQPESPTSGDTTTSVQPPPRPSSGTTASSALGLLSQSTKFMEMLEQNSAVECWSPPQKSDLPRRNFPDEIQTYFDCHELNSYVESEDNIFADMNSFVEPILFQSEQFV